MRLVKVASNSQFAHPFADSMRAMDSQHPPAILHVVGVDLRQYVFDGIVKTAEVQVMVGRVLFKCCVNAILA